MDSRRFQNRQASTALVPRQGQQVFSSISCQVSKTTKYRLEALGLNPDTRQALEALMAKGTGQGCRWFLIPITRSFAATSVRPCWRYWLARAACVQRRSLKRFVLLLEYPPKGAVRIEQCANIMEYYEAYLAGIFHSLEYGVQPYHEQTHP